ncbi:hypothetical protein D3C84_1112180 [compost metagenome]
MRNRDTDLLLAIENIQQEHHPLFTIHGQENRVHLRTRAHTDLNAIPRVQGRALNLSFTALPEVFDDAFRHPGRFAGEAHNPYHTSR